MESGVNEVMFFLLGSAATAVVAAAILSDRKATQNKASDPASSPRATTMLDHDITDMKAGPAATAWKHTERCDLCLCKVGYQEIMTSICLSCGRHFNMLATSGAIREIVRDGAWIQDLLYKGCHYTFDGKNWIPLEPRNA